MVTKIWNIKCTQGKNYQHGDISDGVRVAQLETRNTWSFGPLFRIWQKKYVFHFFRFIQWRMQYSNPVLLACSHVMPGWFPSNINSVWTTDPVTVDVSFVSWLVYSLGYHVITYFLRSVCTCFGSKIRSQFFFSQVVFSLCTFIILATSLSSLL